MKINNYVAGWLFLSSSKAKGIYYIWAVALHYPGKEAQEPNSVFFWQGGESPQRGRVGWRSGIKR